MLTVEENMCGGIGRATIEEILTAEQMGKSCRLYAVISLDPGSSIGYHDHHGESETYYFLRGEGEYDDNGTVSTVKPGDVTYTADGCGHALVNTGKDKLVFTALIILN